MLRVLDRHNHSDGGNGCWVMAVMAKARPCRVLQYVSVSPSLQSSGLCDVRGAQRWFVGANAGVCLVASPLPSLCLASALSLLLLCCDSVHLLCSASCGKNEWGEGNQKGKGRTRSAASRPTFMLQVLRTIQAERCEGSIKHPGRPTEGFE